jgi:hypothetical protein
MRDVHLPAPTSCTNVDAIVRYASEGNKNWATKQDHDNV